MFYKERIGEDLVAFDGLYDGFMFPFEFLRLRNVRKNLMKNVFGNVLEVGTGTGANFNFYDFNKVDRFILLDTALSTKVKNFTFPKNVKVNYIEGSVEELPLESASIDNVVFTLVFCSVVDPLKGLMEINRVLKPGGKIYFIEHVLPHNHLLQSVFNRINPSWSKMAKGCNVNRQTLKTIKDAGFQIEIHHEFFSGAFIEGVGIK